MYYVDEPEKASCLWINRVHLDLCASIRDYIHRFFYWYPAERLHVEPHPHERCHFETHWNFQFRDPLPTATVADGVLLRSCGLHTSYKGYFDITSM